MHGKAMLNSCNALVFLLVHPRTQGVNGSRSSRILESILCNSQRLRGIGTPVIGADLSPGLILFHILGYLQFKRIAFYSKR